MKDFKKMMVWQKSIRMVKMIYKNTGHFPKEEIFGITSQIRRSAISIPSNIAEGSGRGTDKELNHFLNIAQGSAFELETQLIIANELKFINDENYEILIENLGEIQKMITGFQKKLK